MSTPRIPPDIARRIAAMAKEPPAAAPRAERKAQLQAAVPAPAGSFMAKLAGIGWLIAVLAIAAAVGEYYGFAADKEAALAALAAEYEAKLQQSKIEAGALLQKTEAEAGARLQKTEAEAAASQQVLKTELDFEKQPALPLKLIFRPGGVLYVENDSGAAFVCKVRVTRPSSALAKEFSFSINARAFRDLGAIEDWVFASGDRIEFFKPSHKPWTGVFP